MNAKHIIPVLALAALCSCGDSKFDEQPPRLDGEEAEAPTEVVETTSSRDEQYRPQVHYTPSRNWINDPNGLVYLDGTYHMFYQYNPQGNDWGNMSWGHATSTDLMHWTEQPVALTRDDLGDIFSGSAVVDKDNTAGFGKNAIVAIYTSSGERQQQSIAYSTDGGKTFTKYEGNPVIANTSMPDFRDPKVFWHQESKQWVMALAKGWAYEVEFWGSKDLKNWNHLSTFSTPQYARCNKGQWECPDLLRMKYNGQDKWVLIVSTNPGGPVGGSGTFYFPGSFDGTTFTADDRSDYPLWLDYGADNYAGVTWSNVEGRTLFIGWMNNWMYCGNVPCSPWRSAMTLPRELSLTEFDGKPLLSVSVVKELQDMAGEWRDLNGSDMGASDAYQVQVEVDLTGNTVLTLGNEAGEHLDIVVNGGARIITAKRNGKTGATGFNNLFAIPSIAAPLNVKGDKVTLNIYVDRSSVEIETAGGETAMTNLVFPRSIYNRFSADRQVSAKVRGLSSVWH